MIKELFWYREWNSFESKEKLIENTLCLDALAHSVRTTFLNFLLEDTFKANWVSWPDKKNIPVIPD